MLTCVYHPIDEMQVVDEDVAERMKATGVWFDSPVKARQYREKVEDEIKAETPQPKVKGKKQ
jgi:hypothetical protein